MKTILSTFVCAFALCAVGHSVAQNPQCCASAPDSILLSEQTDGQYLVRRYVVSHPSDSAYLVKYRINLATLNATLNGNQKELSNLDAFLGKVMKDTMICIRSVNITGYASPDGPLAFNKSLAAKRAQDFRNFVDRKYNLSQKYKVVVSSEADDWQACRPYVESLPVPDKQYVLNTIGSNVSAAVKEQTLKKEPSAWSYLVRNILPDMRRVDMSIDYTLRRVVEVRTQIPQSQTAPANTADTTGQVPAVVIDDTVTGIIVEMPSEKQIREQERVAAKDGREAKTIGREDLREARRIAKKEAKAAKKAEKMGVKTYKGLEKME